MQTIIMSVLSPSSVWIAGLGNSIDDDDDGIFSVAQAGYGFREQR